MNLRIARSARSVLLLQVPEGIDGKIAVLTVALTALVGVWLGDGLVALLPPTAREAVWKVPSEAQYWWLLLLSSTVNSRWLSTRMKSIQTPESIASEMAKIVQCVPSPIVHTFWKKIKSSKCNWKKYKWIYRFWCVVLPFQCSESKWVHECHCLSSNAVRLIPGVCHLSPPADGYALYQ